MSRSLFIAATACLLAVAMQQILPFLMRRLEERDAKFYQPLPDVPLPKEFHRSGRVTVTHSPASLQNLVDERGLLPTNASVEIAYHTSFSSDETTSTCDPKKHVLIVHSTGSNKDMYHWTKTSLRAAGYEELASTLSPQLESQSVVDRLHAETGVCVTTVDLRGHGNSSITPGPWTVGLLAADVAEALQQIHGKDVKVHANGLSIGFGIVLKLAMDRPNMVWTISGGGFLADMTVNAILAAYIFSNEVVVKLLGMERLGKAAEAAIICAPKGTMSQSLRYIPLEGFLRTSQSWLHFNEGKGLSALQVPVLWQYPVRDDLAGYTLAKVQHEFDQLPVSNGNKIIYYNESGSEDHCYSLLDPDRVFGDVLDFVRANS